MEQIYEECPLHMGREVRLPEQKFQEAQPESRFLHFTQRFYYVKSGEALCPLLSHTWIGNCLQNVKQKVKSNKQDSDQKHIRLDHRIIPVKD